MNVLDELDLRIKNYLASRNIIFMKNSKCHACLENIENNIDRCIHCGTYNFDIEPFKSIPKELKEEIIENSKKPIRDELNENEIEILLKNSFKTCSYEIDYNLEKTDDFNNIVSISPTENGCDLYYNPSILTKFSNREIEAALRHEIFHLITARNVKFPEELSEIDELFFKIYFEMINHKKHVNSIPNDTEFTKLKKYLSNEGICTLVILKNTVNQQIPDGYGTSFEISFNLFKSLELLIYYFYNDTKTINQSIEKYSLQSTWKFFSWINQDMNYIQKKTSNENEVFQYLQLINVLSSFVNIKKMLVENKIEIFKEYEQYLKNANFQNEIGSRLNVFWQERLQRLNHN